MKHLPSISEITGYGLVICREKNRHDGQGLLTWVEYRVIVCLMEGSVFRESWIFHATYRNVFWPNKKRKPKFRRGFQLGPCLACCGSGRGFWVEFHGDNFWQPAIPESGGCLCQVQHFRWDMWRYFWLGGNQKFGEKITSLVVGSWNLPLFTTGF